MTAGFLRLLDSAHLSKPRQHGLTKHNEQIQLTTLLTLILGTAT